MRGITRAARIEALPAAALRAAEDEAYASDVMLVLGTSLLVNPAAGIPCSTLRRGGKIVIVNNQPTPLDSSAALRFDELEPVFTAITAAFSAG